MATSTRHIDADPARRVRGAGRRLEIQQLGGRHLAHARGRGRLARDGQHGCSTPPARGRWPPRRRDARSTTSSTDERLELIARGRPFGEAKIVHRTRRRRRRVPGDVARDARSPGPGKWLHNPLSEALLVPAQHRGAGPAGRHRRAPHRAVGVTLSASCRCGGARGRRRARYGPARRVRRRRNAAAAALPPGAPCTPPPGCADALARYSPSITVSGGPRPGHRPEEQLLVDRGGAAAERAADQVGVGLLQVDGRLDAAGRARARRSPGARCSIGRLHPLGLARDVVRGQVDAGRAGACRPRPTRCRPASGTRRRWSSGRAARTGGAGIRPVARSAA